MQTRHEQLTELFREYDKEHPQVWTLFIKFSLSLIYRGFKNYGAVAVMNRIRWETDKPNVDGASEFKINNNFIPFYARKFMEHFSQYEGFFRTRHQISHNNPAVDLPELTPDDFPYTNQDDPDEPKLF